MQKTISKSLNRDLSLLRKKLPGFPLTYFDDDLITVAILKFPLQALAMGRQLKDDTHYSLLINLIEEALLFSPDINN